MNRKLPADISLWDEECMRIFIEDNSAMFRVFASRYVADPDAIDDFLQEAYIRLWIHRAAIGQVASLQNYFFTLLHHIIMDKQSYLSRKDIPIDEKEVQELPSDTSLFGNIIEAESSCLIAEALKKLSSQSRQVILLSLEGQSIAQIADELHVTVNTVKTVKYRALKRLSELLSKEDFLLLFFLLDI